MRGRKDPFDPVSIAQIFIKIFKGGDCMKVQIAESLTWIGEDLIEEASAESLNIHRGKRRAWRVIAIAAAIMLGMGLWVSTVFRSCGGPVSPEDETYRAEEILSDMRVEMSER